MTEFTTLNKRLKNPPKAFSNKSYVEKSLTRKFFNVKLIRSILNYMKGAILGFITVSKCR